MYTFVGKLIGCEQALSGMDGVFQSDYEYRRNKK